MSLGLVQVYTGNGKGKTTASVGLCVRAKCQGLRVLFAQFMKSRESGEITGLIKLGISVIRFDKVLSPRFHPDVAIEDITVEATSALQTLKPIMGGYDLVVLDEFNNLLDKNVIDERITREFLHAKPNNVELVLTGRGAPEFLVEIADLVTEMNFIKHPYEDKVQARKGIEF